MAKKKRVKPVKPEKKSNLTLIYAGLAVLLIAALALYFSTGTGPEESQEKLPAEGKFVKLNKQSTYEPGKVKITEFLKFNCGHCYQLNPQMPSIKQKYGNRVEITYKPMLWRTMPQDSGFRKSIEAYILAERMGKGEEMKDALFKAMFVENKDLTSEDVLVEIASSVGLGDEFTAALKNGDAKNEAEANIQLAESYQVDETPTIIVNGDLKVTPTLVSGDMTAMANNLDAITGSLLG